MIGNMEQGSTSLSASDCTGYGNYTLQPTPKVFLSHSCAQKGFVEQLYVDLERCGHHPFFDKCRDCVPIGKDFQRLIFEAIEQCEVGVVVLSEEFFTSKWPMLEFVAMVNVQKRKPSFTIMPILLGLTFFECCDVANHKRWLSVWHTLAESDSSIDVKDWENALRLFGPTNALKYNIELGEVIFRAEIVEAICKLVPPRTRFEDSHVQGRSRLCEVIHGRIQHSKVSSLCGVQVVGLYGVGGIGKTTICKSMCNDLSVEYCGKVAHMELGSRGEEELLKDVLRRLTNMNLDYLGAMTIDEYHNCLKSYMVNVKVFLAIDNVSSATSRQALSLLRPKYGGGSVLLVTARSLNELTSLGIDKSECMEMPELEMVEARSLFLYHVVCVPLAYLSNKDDHELILSCVKRCHFKKGDGISSHYHPLALQALGEQFRSIGYVPERWRSLLHEIDYLNPFGEPQHPVFSILRRSFDVLSPQDKLLFMDVALFAPYIGGSVSFKWNVFEWLGMVHGMPVKSVKEGLENLKRKSLLENLGNEFGRISMHDLWREFARLETKVGECNALEEASLTNGGRWINLRRMFFFENGFMKVEDVKFDCFPNLIVLKLSIGLASIPQLDLRGLKHLKSLEVDYGEYTPRRLETWISFVGLGSLSNLGFLRWLNIPPDSRYIGKIAHLTNLRVLELCGCRRVPDLSRLILLQVACFSLNVLVSTIFGLSPKHTNLQFLDLSCCVKLQSCPGVGELVALQELCLQCCSNLKEVPNLQKLKQLKKLDVSGCKLLQALPGLGDLVSLLELNARGCENLVELPDLHNLRNLRRLELTGCKWIQSLRGLHALVCLQSLQTLGCKNLTQLPNMHKLTNLQTLKLDLNAPLQASTGLSDLILLRNLHVRIGELYDGLDLCKLTKLQVLYIDGWQGRGFSSLAELASLEFLTVINCKGLYTLPHLQRLSRLGYLMLRSCDFEDLSGLMNLTNLEELVIRDCDKLHVLPNLQDLALPHLQRLSRLGYLMLWSCDFEDLSGLMNLTNLEELVIRDCDKLHVLPNLQDLGKLKRLKVEDCVKLRDVCGILGLRNLEVLQVPGHPWLHENLSSDLHRFTSLRNLDVSECGFEDLQGLATCLNLRTLVCKGCPIQELPDLANFPKLFALNLRGCVNLTKLICTGPLSPEFRNLDVHGCMRLQALPDLTNTKHLQTLDVSKSGVVLSAQFIQDMKARWPFLHLVTKDTSLGMQGQESSCGIWHRCLGMFASLHCGCPRTSLGVTHSN